MDYTTFSSLIIAGRKNFIVTFDTHLIDNIVVVLFD